MTELITEAGIGKPPVFKKWRNLYLFVVVNFATLVFLFHLFSTSYK